MILAVVITSLLLGGFWVYVVPMIQPLVPAWFQSNKVAQIFAAGFIVLLSVWAVSFALKRVHVRKVV